MYNLLTICWIMLKKLQSKQLTIWKLVNTSLFGDKEVNSIVLIRPERRRVWRVTLTNAPATATVEARRCDIFCGVAEKCEFSLYIIYQVPYFGEREHLPAVLLDSSYHCKMHRRLEKIDQPDRPVTNRRTPLWPVTKRGERRVEPLRDVWPSFRSVKYSSRCRHCRMYSLQGWQFRRDT